MKNLKYSRSPFINLSRSKKLLWMSAIWHRWGQSLYRNLNTYHDIDNGTGRTWFARPFFKISSLISKFNRYWINSFGRLICRHHVMINVDVNNTNTIYSYLEENNPSKWYWVNQIENSLFASLRHENTFKMEICFVFKNEAMIYRLKAG